VSELTSFDGRDIVLPEGDREAAARRVVDARLAAARELAGGDHAGPAPDASPTRPESRAYLFEEACELYLNELNWEELTDEEKVDDGELTEMVFPGLLAFVDALLLGGDPGGDSDASAHPDVVRDFLVWLAARLNDLRAAADDSGGGLRARREAGMAEELVDLVAGRLYGLDREEMGRLRG
jgi:hypothetical protein